MFSLIISIIALVLVAAIAVATIFYGGSMFTSGGARAKAATLSNHSQQLLAAIDVFHNDLGRYPNNLQELVTNQYLKAIPSTTSQADLVNPAHAQSVDYWTMPVAGEPTVMLRTEVSSTVCQEINYASNGFLGIANKVYASYKTQCYSSPSSELIVLATKKGNQYILPALTTMGQEALYVDSATAPVDNVTSSEWEVPPLARVAQVPTTVGTTTPPPSGGNSTLPESTPQPGQFWFSPVINVGSIQKFEEKTVSLLFTNNTSTNYTLHSLQTSTGSSLYPMGMTCSDLEGSLTKNWWVALFNKPSFQLFQNAIASRFQKVLVDEWTNFMPMFQVAANSSCQVNFSIMGSSTIPLNSAFVRFNYQPFDGSVAEQQSYVPVVATLDAMGAHSQNAIIPVSATRLAYSQLPSWYIGSGISNPSGADFIEVVLRNNSTVAVDYARVVAISRMAGGARQYDGTMDWSSVVQPGGDITVIVGSPASPYGTDNVINIVVDANGIPSPGGQLAVGIR